MSAVSRSIMSRSKSTSVSSVGMVPSVEIIRRDESLTFEIKNSNVSFVNALRRVILSEIETVVFRTTPYDKSLTTIHKNTTRLTNEIINQRLSCIPIHITDNKLDVSKLKVILNVKNDSDTLKYVTTEHFQIENTDSNTMLNDEVVKQYFPKNEITGDYILLNRLRPRISDTIPGEELHIESILTRSTASEDSCFNVSSTCSYSFIVDRTKQDQVWKEKVKELTKKGMNKDDIDNEYENWKLNDGKRIYIPNSFEFVLQTVGVYTNEEIIRMACEVMIKKCNSLIEQITSQNVTIKPSNTTMKNAVDITLKNEDYTLGKCIEFVLHNVNYRQEKQLLFVGFLKNHPYDTDSIIRIQSKKEPSSNGYYTDMLLNATNTVKKYFKKMGETFGISEVEEKVEKIPKDDETTTVAQTEAADSKTPEGESTTESVEPETKKIVVEVGEIEESGEDGGVGEGSAAAGVVEEEVTVQPKEKDDISPEMVSKSPEFDISPEQ